MYTLSLGKGQAYPIEDSISISSESSEASQEGSDSAPGDAAPVCDQETDTDDIKLIEKPPKKRIRGM